jgi:hypothetical protein
LVPSWSAGLVERGPLRTDSSQAASVDTPIKASVKFAYSCTWGVVCCGMPVCLGQLPSQGIYSWQKW